MPTWRQMTLGDIPAVLNVADKVHPDLPESADVFAERVKLYPKGCLILEDNEGPVCGYTIAHPIRHHRPPNLNSLLGEISPEADQFYIHDVAILPEHRGRGSAAEAVQLLLTIAGQHGHLTSTCLVSVYGTSRFWARFGFAAERAHDDEVLAEKLRGYGDDATFMSLEHQS